MSDAGRTHYELLGLTSDASQDQIRKRYRELARKYHPDLNPNLPDAQKRFIQITQAYEVLNDPNRRANYDLTLRDQARRAASSGSSGMGGSSGSKGASPPRPGSAAPNWSENFSSNGARSGRSAAPGGTERARQEAERRRQAVSRLLDEAQQAYARGHLGDALRLCSEILRQSTLDVAQAGAAYELRGDIFNRQRRFDEAIAAYTMAVQRLPRYAGRIMGKLNAAEAKGGRAREVDLEGMRDRIVGGPTPAGRTAYRLSVSSFGLAVLLFLMFWRPVGDVAPLKLPLVGSWTLSHLAFMGLDGFLCGALLAAAAWIRPIDQELFDSALGSPRRSVPLGVLLSLFGAVFLPLAFGLYLVMAYLQQSLSASVLAVLTAAVALTFGFIFAAGSNTQMQMETLIFGGNVIFLSMLCGWFIGDLFRPSWSM